MIHRGTTPIIRFKLDVDTSKISNLTIFFSQGGEVILTKTFEDITIKPEESLVATPLTREETLQLEANKDLHMQLVLEFNDGRISSSRYLTEYVYDIMDEET